jgi:hypothetical protein
MSQREQVAHLYNPSPQEAEAGRSPSSRPARFTQHNTEEKRTVIWIVTYLLKNKQKYPFISKVQGKCQHF